MDTKTAIILVIALAAVTVAVWAIIQRNRTRHLRAAFGPEYDRTLDRSKSSREAEAILDERQRRVSKFHIRPLSPEECERFTAEWHAVQEHFVDSPRSAVSQADELINQALRTRGYPVSEFDRRADDLSVHHPRVVENFRIAHEIAVRDERGEGNTEDLRKAMQYYRSLFEDVLESHGSLHDEVHHQVK